MIEKFDEECHGMQRSLSDKITGKYYEGYTAIDRIIFQYILKGRKVSSVSDTAKVIQFLLRLCFATTSYKFQGQMVHKPDKVVVGLRTYFYSYYCIRHFKNEKFPATANSLQIKLMCLPCIDPIDATRLKCQIHYAN